MTQFEFLQLVFVESQHEGWTNFKQICKGDPTSRSMFKCLTCCDGLSRLSEGLTRFAMDGRFVGQLSPRVLTLGSLWRLLVIYLFEW